MAKKTKAVTTKTKAGRIRFIRKLHKLTQEEFAAVLGTTRGAVGNWELGKGIKLENLTQIATQFSVQLEWLGQGTGPEPTLPEQHIESGHVMPPDVSPNDVEIIGYIIAGGALDRFPVGASLDTAPRPAGASSRTVAVEIRGVSLGKPFDRWLVYYDDVRSPITDDLVGQLCVVGLADERVLIKVVRRGKDGLFSLVSNNSEEPTIENVALEWAALVNDIRRRR
jgi:transcriptional regulator with XRE-family HTH domain